MVKTQKNDKKKNLFQESFFLRSDKNIFLFEGRAGDEKKKASQKRWTTGEVNVLGRQQTARKKRVYQLLSDSLWRQDKRLRRHGLGACFRQNIIDQSAKILRMKILREKEEPVQTCVNIPDGPRARTRKRHTRRKSLTNLHPPSTHQEIQQKRFGSGELLDDLGSVLDQRRKVRGGHDNPDDHRDQVFQFTVRKIRVPVEVTANLKRLVQGPLIENQWNAFRREGEAAEKKEDRGKSKRKKTHGILPLRVRPWTKSYSDEKKNVFLKQLFTRPNIS